MSRLIRGRRAEPVTGMSNHPAQEAPWAGGRTSRGAGMAPTGSNGGKEEALAGSPARQLHGFPALPSSGSPLDAGVLQLMEAVGCSGMPWDAGMGISPTGTTLVAPAVCEEGKHCTPWPRAGQEQARRQAAGSLLYNRPVIASLFLHGHPRY